MYPELTESIYKYIEQNTIHDGDGVSWNAFGGPKARPERVPGLYTGAAGVSYFLIDYYRKTGKEQSLNLAVSGLKWALQQDDS